MQRTGSAAQTSWLPRRSQGQHAEQLDAEQLVSIQQPEQLRVRLQHQAFLALSPERSRSRLHGRLLQGQGPARQRANPEQSRSPLFVAGHQRGLNTQQVASITDFVAQTEPNSSTSVWIVADLTDRVCAASAAQAVKNCGHSVKDHQMAGGSEPSFEKVKRYYKFTH